MTSDQARKLLGGYATGSLSEAERAALFQAALEDQELFDELAGEQVLKEVLDEPGARQRLIATLAPPRHRAWLWVTAAAAAGLAIVVGVVVSPRTQPPPQEIAQVLKSSEPAAPPEPVAPPVAALRPAPPPVVKRKIAPTPPAPPAVPELQKAEAENKLADQLQPAAPQAAAGAVREFAASDPRIVFGFRYSVTAEGYLEITPSVSGFLAVTSSDAVVFSSSLVGVSTLRFAIPPGVASLVISFSRTEGITGTPVRRDAPTGRETDQDPPNGRILIQLFLTPATQ